MVDPSSATRTMTAGYGKGGGEFLLRQDGNPRMLTPRECARLMGFPDTFRFPVSNKQAWHQLGNSVVVPLVAEIARVMRPHILSSMSKKETDL